MTKSSLLRPKPFGPIGDGILARARQLTTATLHEASGRTGALPHAIKPIMPTMRFAGRALPVRCPAGDNLWIHRALAIAERDDVLVVDAGPWAGELFGYWGELMATAATVRHLAAFVITGGVRDSLRLIEIGLPTFCAGISVRGTTKNAESAGAVGEPVRIGEIVIRHGDLIVGDADGVVAFPADLSDKIVAASEQRDADEVAIISQLQSGASTLSVYNF